MKIAYRHLGPRVDLLLPTDMAAPWGWTTCHDGDHRSWNFEQKGGYISHYAHDIGLVSRYLGAEEDYTAVWVDASGLENDVTDLGKYRTLAKARRAVESYRKTRCPTE